MTKLLGLTFAAALALYAAAFCAAAVRAGPTGIPTTSASALDGHTVRLPHDLASGATILILGFSRHSAAPTTAWEKPTRSQLAAPPTIAFYDMPMLAEVPSFLRSLVLHSIRRQVPDVLKPHFVPLITDEAAWKQIAHYTPTAPDAAYILLVDRAGNVHWQTYEPYSPALFAQLIRAARNLEADSR
jgi:hypothetical protein